jgi:tripeptidyl-peptidase-1
LFLTTSFPRQKLGSRGLTIIFASGDSGTGCSFCYRFDPSFPATSPSLTSVGATEFIASSGPVTPGTQEQAVSEFGSGGGFSWTFDRPSYQAAAVNNYLQNHSDVLPARFHWRQAGRGTPDVAALGIGFSVVVSGGVELIGGTSASAPTFSAVISLLNEQQLLRGRPPLGFLNNWLYQSAAASSSAFFDVVQGNNADGCCIHGFRATQGWDAVTGLGTPNYRQLKAMLP